MKWRKSFGANGMGQTTLFMIKMKNLEEIDMAL